MKDDIRRATCIVIRKNGAYLMGFKLFCNGFKWSSQIYDAWQTRNMETAKKIAQMTGGIMVLFNPIANQKRVIGA